MTCLRSCFLFLLYELLEFNWKLLSLIQFNSPWFYKFRKVLFLRLGPPFVALFIAISDKIDAANKQNLQSSPPPLFKYVSTRSLKSFMARLSVSICGTGRSQYTWQEHAFNQISVGKWAHYLIGAPLYFCFRQKQAMNGSWKGSSMQLSFKLMPRKKLKGFALIERQTCPNTSNF